MHNLLNYVANVINYVALIGNGLPSAGFSYQPKSRNSLILPQNLESDKPMVQAIVRGCHRFSFI